LSPSPLAFAVGSAASVLPAQLSLHSPCAERAGPVRNWERASSLSEAGAPHSLRGWSLGAQQPWDPPRTMGSGLGEAPRLHPHPSLLFRASGEAEGRALEAERPGSYCVRGPRYWSDSRRACEGLTPLSAAVIKLGATAGPSAPHIARALADIKAHRPARGHMPPALAAVAFSAPLSSLA
jgi:hypothetical protein